MALVDLIRQLDDEIARHRSDLARLERARDALGGASAPDEEPVGFVGAAPAAAPSAVPPAPAAQATEAIRHCGGCDEDRPAMAFAKNSSDRSGYQSQCRRCQSARRKRKEKTCTGPCGKTLPLSDFYGPYDGSGRYSVSCRSCTKDINLQRKRDRAAARAAARPDAPPTKALGKKPRELRAVIGALREPEGQQNWDKIAEVVGTGGSSDVPEETIAAIVDATAEIPAEAPADRPTLPYGHEWRAFEHVADEGPHSVAQITGGPQADTTVSTPPSPKERIAARKAARSGTAPRGALLRERMKLREAQGALRCKLQQLVAGGEKNDPVGHQIRCGGIVFGQHQAVRHLAEVHGLDASYRQTAFDVASAVEDDEAA